jgi:hypothetical protein
VYVFDGAAWLTLRVGNFGGVRAEETDDAIVARLT